MTTPIATAMSAPTPPDLGELLTDDPPDPGGDALGYQDNQPTDLGATVTQVDVFGDNDMVGDDQ